MSGKRVRNAFDRDQVVTECFGGRTQQNFKDECDINFIVDRWLKRGVLTHVTTAQPLLGEFDGPEDFQEAVSRVFEAQEAFENLPSEIRNRFANNPAELLAFVGDEANQREAQELGLLNAPATSPPGGEGDPAGEPPTAAGTAAEGASPAGGGADAPP